MSTCQNYTTGQQVALMIRARKMALRVFVHHEETDWELVKKYSRLVAGFCGLLVRRFIAPIQRQFVALTRIFRARHRQPVRRSAAKSGGDDNGGDDGGGDSESDPGDPPGPKLVLPSHNFHSIPQLNSLIPSRTIHPCRWSLDWRCC